ncbi:MAG TPA: hypothetical protein VL985_10705 [Stellaceae bacterium]|nr:hypothetical protein [Stellaceae bacterium]
MEYIRVTFDPGDIRDVLASGDIIGKTETELILQANYYVVALTGAGYTPLYWHGLVSGTSVDNPLIIPFSKA